MKRTKKIIYEGKGEDGCIYTKFDDGSVGHLYCPCLKKRKNMKKKNCKHDATFGGVGAKKHVCIDCAKIIDNPDYADELKEIANAKLHPNSRTNHIAIAKRRLEKFKKGEGKVITLDELLKRIDKKQLKSNGKRRTSIRKVKRTK